MHQSDNAVPPEQPGPHLRDYWTRLLSDPETYDPRAGGFVFVGASDVADILRDGLGLLDRVAELEAALAERGAEVAALRAVIDAYAKAYGELGRAALGE